MPFYFDPFLLKQEIKTVTYFIVHNFIVVIEMWTCNKLVKFFFFKVTHRNINTCQTQNLHNKKPISHFHETKPSQSLISPSGVSILLWTATNFTLYYFPSRIPQNVVLNNIYEKNAETGEQTKCVETTVTKRVFTVIFKWRGGPAIKRNKSECLTTALYNLYKLNGKHWCRSLFLRAKISNKDRITALAYQTNLL